MNYKEVALLKEGDKILIKDGIKSIFVSDLRKRLAYFANNKVAHLEIDTVCDDTDHCVSADSSDGRIHQCYGHTRILWPAQIVKKI